jgi:hypothetical protein
MKKLVVVALLALAAAGAGFGAGKVMAGDCPPGGTNCYHSCLGGQYC